MSWSFVSTNASSSTGTFTPSAWPSTVQAGDIVVFASTISPEGENYEYSCTTLGWQKPTPSQDSRLMWTRYSATQALPTLTQGTSSATVYWRMLAYRPTGMSAMALLSQQQGNPEPPATSYTTTSASTLFVVWATTSGDPGPSGQWEYSGPINDIREEQLGNGSGNPLFPNRFLGDGIISSAGAAYSSIRAYVTPNFSTRYYVLAFGEGDLVSPLFFHLT